MKNIDDFNFNTNNNAMIKAFWKLSLIGFLKEFDSFMPNIQKSKM